MFTYPHISLLAILAAAVAHFALGMLWYSQLTPLGKRWMTEAGMTGDRPRPGLEMLVFPLSSIMAAWPLAMVFGWSGAENVSAGISVSLVLAFGVTGQVLASGIASPRRSLALFAINVGYVVVGYALMGAVIALLT